MAKKKAKKAAALKVLAAIAIGHCTSTGKVYFGFSNCSTPVSTAIADLEQQYTDDITIATAGALLFVDKIIEVKGKAAVAVEKLGAIPTETITL